jgi:CMP-N-acetylneuraminic acid synthetase
MTEPERVLALIPARGGSQGIRHKNLARVDGISLVGRAALLGCRFAALHPQLQVRVVVDSDDPAILDEGLRWGAEAPYRRPAELAGPEVSTYASTAYLLERLQRDGFEVQTVLLLQPTSPLRSIADVRRCWERYDPPQVPSVISVSEAAKSPRLAMGLDGSGALRWDGEPPSPNARRQDFPVAYYPNGGVYVEQTAFLRDHRAFIVAGTSHGVVTPSSSAIDVDTESDLLLANALARLGSGQPPRIETLASLREARERSARAGEAWLRDAEAPREWVGRGPGQLPGVVIEGTAGPADASSPGLSVWRCLGADPLTLAIGDAAVLNRYREQLYVPDVILAPAGVSEQVRALLRMSAPC